MRIGVSPTMRKCLRERRLRRSVAGVAGRARKRAAFNAESAGWRRVATVLLVVHAAPDGRHMGLRTVLPGLGAWERCGTERAVRGALARELWGLGRMRT